MREGIKCSIMSVLADKRVGGGSNSSDNKKEWPSLLLLFKIKVSVKLHCTLSSVDTVFVDKMEASNSVRLRQYLRIYFWED
jgi:hypothetical protein